MKTALASNVTWQCELWRMEATNGTVARYTTHSRHLTFNSEVYAPVFGELSRSARKIGLSPDSFELSIPFDSVITKASIANGVWQRARVTKYQVDYTNLALGYAQSEAGFVGIVSVKGEMATIECVSLRAALAQEMGAVTGPTDRLRTVLELTGDESAVSHTTVVDVSTDRATFRITFFPAAPVQLQYGRVIWTSGANAGLEMEIKSADEGEKEITLQLPMPSDIEAGDELTIVEGYDGSRAEAVRLDGDATNMRAEPDLPGVRPLIQYPS